MNKLVGLLMGLALVFPSAAAEKKIVLLAGSRSHGMGEHEFRAGCLLLKSCLDQVPGVTAVVYSNGWPTRQVNGKSIEDNAAFEGASSVFIYADGGDGHPAIRPDRLKFLDSLVDRGVGIGCSHYAVEVPKGEAGDAMLRWTGGYFEMFWSVNPHWEADFTSFPVHPITRGVKPFKIRDEWYYHMRFPEDMKGVQPILTALPPDGTRGREGQTDPHGGNPHVRARKGMPEHVMWAIDRPNGSRGFGFTGGHFHRNWGDDNFRKVVLNAILWSAQIEVPSEGVASVIKPEQLKENLDFKDRSGN